LTVAKTTKVKRKKRVLKFRPETQSSVSDFWRNSNPCFKEWSCGKEVTEEMKGEDERYERNDSPLNFNEFSKY